MKPILARLGTVWSAILLFSVCAQAADKSSVKLTSVIAARESWLKGRTHRIALDFLCALNEGLQLARESAKAVKRALRKYTRAR